MDFPLFFSTGFGLLCCARDPCGTDSELHIRSWVHTEAARGTLPWHGKQLLWAKLAAATPGGNQLKESLKHTPKLRGDTQTHQAELSLQDETLGNKTWGYLSLGPEVLHNLVLKTVRVLLFKCHKGRWGTWNSFSGVSQNFLSKFLTLNWFIPFNCQCMWATVFTWQKLNCT